MELNKDQKSLLKKLPGVDRIFELTASDIYFKNIPKSVQIACIREILAELRDAIVKKKNKYQA